MPKIRALLVDDSVVVRRVLSDCLNSEPDIEVAATAASGSIALDKLQQVNPDVVILDLEMEGLNGIQTLTALRKVRPKLPVIIFSTLSERGASQTLEALAAGANDYATKPTNSTGIANSVEQIRADLVPKIKALCAAKLSILASSGYASPSAPGAPFAEAKADKVADLSSRIIATAEQLNPVSGVQTAGRPALSGLASQPGTKRTTPPDVIAIGVSTGGPNALAALLPDLAPDISAPVLIVQHMPPLFTRMLAERIRSLTGRIAREGEEGAIPQPGEIWVAPGGRHMDVQRFGNEVRLHLHDDPPENSCRPAVDVLFRSVARIYGARALAVVLTGMGQDGLIGCQHIHEVGGQIIVQDEASSVVWGMPGAVATAGLAEKILPLSALAQEINGRFPRRVSRPS